MRCIILCWTANGTTTIGSDTFNIFDNGHAERLVDADITLGGEALGPAG